MFRMDNSDNRDYLLPHKMDSSLEDWVERWWWILDLEIYIQNWNVELIVGVMWKETE